MTGTKRDYTQYLQSTRKVNISDLIAQQAQHNAPRAHAGEYRSSQPTTSRYRPYHQEVAGYQPPAPTRASAPAPQQGYTGAYAGNGAQSQAYSAAPQQHMVSPYAAMSAHHPPHAFSATQVARAAPVSAPNPVPAPALASAPNFAPPAAPVASAPHQFAPDIPAPPWADDESYAASWDNMPPPPESFGATDWDDVAPMPFALGNQSVPSASPVAPQPIAQTQAVTTLSEVKLAAPAAQVAAPAAQSAAPAAQSAAPAAPVAKPATQAAVPSVQPQASSSTPVAIQAPASSLAPQAAPRASAKLQSATPPQVVAIVGAQAGAKVVASGYQRPDMQRNVKRASDEAAPKAGFLKPTPACDDMPDFEAVLALPKLFYQELVAKFTQEGVADPAQAAREATTMHPELAEKAATSAAEAAVAAAPAASAKPEVRFNAQLLAARTEDAASGESAGDDNDGWHAAKSADDIEIKGDFKGWPGALLYQGNFEERMRGIWAAQGLELVSIEDKQFQKLCVLKAGGYQFKLSAFYKDYGAISYVQSSAVGSKASLARAALEDYVGFDIRNLPDLTTLSDEEKAQIKKEVRARNKKKKRKTLSERNADLKLASAATATQVVNYGQVDVEALAAAGKDKLMTVVERIQLVLKSFDPLFKVTQGEVKPFNLRFDVEKPGHYNFEVRVYHKKDETISSIFIKTSEELEALPNSVECLMLLEQVKEALMQSLVGTSIKILVKPRSAKVNENHVLEVAYVQF